MASWCIKNIAATAVHLEADICLSRIDNAIAETQKDFRDVQQALALIQSLFLFPRGQQRQR